MAENYRLGDDVDLDVEDVRLKDGTRLTDKRAEQIAEDVLRRRRGRPSLAGDAETSPRVSFRIPEQLRRTADERARREGRTVSELAREALEHYLAEKG
jgi:predicted HicB family RNase H-like nuclease